MPNRASTPRHEAAWKAEGRDRGEQSRPARNSFELSQTVYDAWLTAEFAEKRKILDSVFLNFRLDGVTL